jgi:hypothetical protein
MTTDDFEITQEQLDSLLSLYPNTGKNSDVGSMAVRIVEMYFKNKHPDATFLQGSKGADIQVNYNGKSERYEVKGTIDHSIAWQKLKVSSQDCHDCLLNGMILIRVTSIGLLKMKLHFLKHGEDFLLQPEVRFAVKPIRQAKIIK